MSYDNYENAEKFLRIFVQSQGITLLCDQAIRKISDDIWVRNGHSFYFEDKPAKFIMKSVDKYRDYLTINLSLDDPDEKRTLCDSCGDYGDSSMEITGHNGKWSMEHHFGCYGSDSLFEASKDDMIEKLRSLQVQNQSGYKYQNRALKETIREIQDSPAT